MSIKKLRIHLIPLLLFIFLTSCSTNIPPSSPDDNSTAPSIPYPTESSAVLYVNQRLLFSMELPLTWLGKVEIEESYDVPHQDGGHCITFYHKPTHDDNPDMGILFMIDCYPGTWTAENPPVIAGSSDVVLQTDTNTFLFRTPSDVQWNENDSLLSDDYHDLEGQFDFIKNHISAI